jgi:hypothetical protein
MRTRIDMKPDDFKNKQEKVTLSGIDVFFPFKPYECQNDYMDKVI